MFWYKHISGQTCFGMDTFLTNIFLNTNVLGRTFSKTNIFWNGHVLGRTDLQTENVTYSSGFPTTVTTGTQHGSKSMKSREYLKNCIK